MLIRSIRYMFAKLHSFPTPIVSVDYLKQHLNDVKIIDASWYLASHNRNADAEFKKEHIPNAVRFDLDEISLKETDLPHMLPTKEQFDLAVSELGISNTDKIVIYDGMHMFASPRVYWTFKYFGHGDVSVLDGGLPAWKRANGWLSDAPAQIKNAKYTSQPREEMVKDIEFILNNIKSLHKGGAGSQVLDARPAARFTGEVPEPRPISSGHMPFSTSVPFTELLTAEGFLKSDNELKEVFDNKKVNLNKNIVCSCGSGTTAAIIYLALQKIGVSQNVSLFDGSWTQYAADPRAEILKQ